MGEKRNAYRLLIGKLEGKKSLGTHRHMWKNIKMDPKKADGRALSGFI